MEREQIIKRVSRTISQDVERLDACYLWGSRCYKTHTDSSDYDIICVGDVETGHEYRNGDLNIHTLNTTDWHQHLHDHAVMEIECLFLPQECRIVDRLDVNFNLDLVKLRHVWSAKASNSWVKAKKKIDVADEWYIGQKSLFHSLRMINFAIQLASTNRIDLTQANHYWDEIKNIQKTSWSNLQNKWQMVYNQHMTDFRKIAPK